MFSDVIPHGTMSTLCFQMDLTYCMLLGHIKVCKGLPVMCEGLPVMHEVTEFHPR